MQNKILNRVKWAMEAAKASTENYQTIRRIEDIEIHFNGYAEPGYTDPSSGIIATGNWNNVSGYENEDKTIERLASVLETLGCELEWSDEWGTCNECCKIIRTSADSWGWTPSYHIGCDGLECVDCIDMESYLESIEGDASSLNTLCDPESHGYDLVFDKFENGLYRGQNADPELIGELMNDAGFSRWLLSVDRVGQFDASFSLWLHKSESEQDDYNGLIKAKRTIERGKTDGPDIASAMRRSLEEAAHQADKLKGSCGVIVSKVSVDGAETKVVSYDDFVNGKALD